jgi:hypothetical protein
MPYGLIVTYKSINYDMRQMTTFHAIFIQFCYNQHMNQKTFKNTVIFIIIGIILIGAIGYIAVINKKPSKATQVPVATQIVYANTQYGFNFTLPASWKGYTIVTSNWQGDMVEEPSQKLTGPEISIRNPLWTSANPRQDIPIMIFTPAQWGLIQQERLSLGAAPVGPSELGHNANYYFALPARYNFAFPTGYEEVDQIIANKPLQAF